MSKQQWDATLSVEFVRNSDMPCQFKDVKEHCFTETFRGCFRNGLCSWFILSVLISPIFTVFLPLGFCSTTHSHCNFLLLQHPPTDSLNNILGSSGTMTILVHNNYITIHLHAHPTFSSNFWGEALTNQNFTKRATWWPTKDATLVLEMQRGCVKKPDTVITAPILISI